MSLADLAAFAGAIPLVVLVWWGVTGAGALAGRLFRLRTSRQGPADAVLGLAVLYLAGLLLSLAGLFRPTILAVLALGAGLVSAPSRVSKLSLARPRTSTPLAVAAGSVALVFAVMALTPVVHYDLTANYLAVARDFLVRGTVAPLAGNVHSGTSTFLHLVLAVLLAVGRPLNTSLFPLTDHHVYSVALAGAVLLTGGRLRRLAELLVERRRDAGWAALYGLLLWLVMPQTLLLFALKYTEFLTTYLVVSAVVMVLEPGLEGSDSAVLGVLLGLILAAKLQLAPVVLAIAVVGVLRRPRHLPVLALGAAALAVPSIVRSLLAYGVPLYPYTPGAGDAAHAARSLLAENAAALPRGFSELVGRLVRLVTRQPETGFTLLLVLPALLRWPRRPALLLILTVPFATVAAVSGANVAGLRWLQYLIPIALTAAGAALAPRVRPLLRGWSLLALVTASGALALGFTGRVIGLTDHLTSPRSVWIARFDDTFGVRRQLATTRTRVLWAGFGETFYTSPGDVATSIHDGAALAPWLDAPTANELASRLEAARIGYLAWDHRHDGELTRSDGYWWWVTPSRRRVILDLLARREVVLRDSRTTVYRIAGNLSGPGSRPSPP